MNICEGCVKQDVCKFKEEVEKYEEKGLPEPLTPKAECKYKETSVHYLPYYPYPITITSDWPWLTSPAWTTTTSDYISTS